MDPSLQELLKGAPDTTIEVLVKTKDFKPLAGKFTPIAQFGDIASGRVRRQDIIPVWKLAESVKASRFVSIDPPRKPEDTELGKAILEDEAWQSNSTESEATSKGTITTTKGSHFSTTKMDYLRYHWSLFNFIGDCHCYLP